MFVKSRAVARGVAIVLTMGSAVLLGAVPQASAVVSHKPLNDTRAVGSAPIRVAFPIEYFGLVADLPSSSGLVSKRGETHFGEARFFVRGKWTKWRSLGQDGAQQAGHFTGALVSVDQATAYQVRRLPTGARHWRAAAINTTDGPSAVVARGRTGGAQASAPCRSRADWGADESLTGWSKGSDTQAFYPVQALTVHHTAGSNDASQDYAATVRAIYSYHVQTNGWSDIGYQYLVDGRGVVYEGRNSGHTSVSCLSAGGDGSDFAHQTGTNSVVNGAHVAGYNAGNAGVALMGCYEATSACSGDTTPPSAAVEGLTGLLASLATRHHLDPEGSVHYVNPVNGTAKDVKVISGHRDWEATACPGGVLYARLPTIRTDVASRVAGTTTVPGAPASLTATVSASAVSLAWAPPSAGGSPTSSYEVFRDTSSSVSLSNPALYAGSATSASDRPAAGTYYYAVRACNSVGCGPLTTSGQVTVPPRASITSGSCSASSCTFTGSGTGQLTWSFGNGKSGTGSPVSTTYVAKGSYTVRLSDGQTPATQTTRIVTCSIVKRTLRCTT